MKLHPDHSAFAYAAFADGNNTHGGAPGLTRREYYAAHAPITFMEAYAQCGFQRGVLTDAERQTLWAVMALMRLEYADALIKALNGEKKQVHWDLSDRLREAAKHKRTPEEREAQRQSFMRAFSTPCEHGSLDWETCQKCLALNDGEK